MFDDNTITAIVAVLDRCGIKVAPDRVWLDAINAEGDCLVLGSYAICRTEKVVHSIGRRAFTRPAYDLYVQVTINGDRWNPPVEDEQELASDLDSVWTAVEQIVLNERRAEVRDAIESVLYEQDAMNEAQMSDLIEAAA